MSQTSTKLTVDKLCKTFENAVSPVEVLKEVNLQMVAGDAAAITGPSGSGKSTLLHIIGTLDQPTSGSLSLNGQNPFDLQDADLARFRNRVIGFIFQDHHLLPQFTVIENVLVPVLAFGKSNSEQRSRAEELLKRVGLSHRIDHRPAQLSGGERQRVAIARALINDPDVILCDEPTGNLDQTTAGEVADLLFELLNESPKIMICVTHSLELASRFSKRLQIRDGRLLPG